MQANIVGQERLPGILAAPTLASVDDRPSSQAPIPELTTAPNPAAELDACLRPLFARFPSATDPLLDLRRAWLERGSPGTCVRMYFALCAQVPRWRRGELANLQDLLEHRIRLWIVIQESAQRRCDCLGLNRADSLEDYCKLVMREAARSATDARHLNLSFAWS